jgi:hypothetical protein
MVFGLLKTILAPRAAYTVKTDGIIAEDIFAWYPILNEQVHKASSLRNHIESLLSGRMSV